MNEELLENLMALMSELYSINVRLSAMIDAMKLGEEQLPSERKLPLFVSPALFKGLKPVSLTFPDGREIAVSKWRDLATVLLQDCNADEACHENLHNMCGKVYGRNRIILGHDPLGMDVPLKVDEDIYFEGKFDTESLLKVLTERVLRPAGYDYRFVTITATDPRQPSLSETNAQADEDFHMTQQM